MRTLEENKLKHSEECCEVGGQANKAFAFYEGRKAMVKENNKPEECYAEYLAYKLGTYLGIKVNEVILGDCGRDFGWYDTSVSIHIWEDNLVMGDKFLGGLSNKARHTMQFFDDIIDNGDRHGSNYGILNKELFLIDHGYADPWSDLDSGSYQAQDIAYGTVQVLKHNPRVILKLMTINEDNIGDIINIDPTLKFHEFEEIAIYNKIELVRTRLLEVVRLVKKTVSKEMISKGGQIYESRNR